MAKIQQSDSLSNPDPYSEIVKILAETSWEALRPDIINELCKCLDEEQHIKTANGVARDWRGLQMLTRLNNNETAPPQTSNSTKQFLEFIRRKQKERPGSLILSIKDLLENLADMDRCDIIARLFEKRPKSTEPMILEDCCLAQKKYDAVLLYANDDNDKDFALDLKIARMDKCCLDTYMYDYDIPSDVVKHDIRLIIEQKRFKQAQGHIVVILSPAFLDSSTYRFLVNDVCNSDPSLNIIPVIWKKCDCEKCVKCEIEKCEKSNFHFSIRSAIPYSRKGMGNFYERLLGKTLLVKEELLTEPIKKYCFMGDDDNKTYRGNSEEKGNVNVEKLPWLKTIKQRLKASIPKKDNCVPIEDK